MTPLLPPGFSDLEPFVADWCLDSEPERYAKRLSSTMEEIQQFYDAIMPRVPAAIGPSFGPERHPIRAARGRPNARRSEGVSL